MAVAKQEKSMEVLKIFMLAGPTQSSSEVLGSPELSDVDPLSQICCEIETRV